MSITGSLGSPSTTYSNNSGPSKDFASSLTGSENNLPRDFSRLSLFSASSTTFSQDEHFRCEGHAEHSLSSMKNYFQSGKLCDVTLIAENKRVRAHRYFLNLILDQDLFQCLFNRFIFQL